MTTSLYKYITVANLEAYTGINYETTDVGYTDVFVEANITVAERSVNSMCVEAPASATDGVIVATLILSERLMRNVMVVDGYAEEMPQTIIAFFDYLIETVLAPNIYSPAGNVPSQGIDR